MYQQTLFEYHDPAEFTTETFDKTAIFHFRPPTDRKYDRIETMLSEAGEVTRIAEQRLPSVPRERWGSATSKGNTWYKWAKEIDHEISNKDAVANIQRVREAFRRWQSEGYDGEKPAFKKDDRCTIDYEKPKYKVHNDRYYLSLQMAAGRGEREWFPLRDGEYIREIIDNIRNGEYSKTRSELLRRDHGYEFHQGIRREIETLTNPRTRIGVDIGLTNLAVVGAVDESDEKHGAELWSGSEAAEIRERFYQQRKRAQTDTKFEDIRDTEYKYVENVCHTISRGVVEWALNHERPEIVMEDLSDIRDRFIRRERDHSPDDRRVLHSWPFRKMQDMIEYKARESGIPVTYLTTDETRYTSQDCNECGHRSDDNRDGVHFECIECGYQVNADVNGAFNIASRKDASAKAEKH